MPSYFSRFWTTWWCLAIFCFLLPSPLLAQTQPSKLWDFIYGGNDYDALTSMHPTTDGGYILGGYSASGSSGDKSQNGKGGQDYWLVKITATGNKQWDRTVGGDKDDYLQVVRQTTDGGYILGGYSSSSISGDRTALLKIEPNSLTATDYWLVKLDAQGNKQWNKAYGGGGTDLLATLQQTADGGYIFGGKSYSEAFGDKSQPRRGGDFWVVKVDAQGTRQWERSYGGEGSESLASLQQTPEGGYILGGSSTSGVSGDRTATSRGSNDFWLLKVNALGVPQWDQAYGGSGDDGMTSLQQTVDGGYILAGGSSSPASGDKSQPRLSNRGAYDDDFWVVKTTATGNLQWERTFGGADIDLPRVVRQTADQGYIVGGCSTSGISFDKTQPNQGDGKGFDFDYWVIKLDATGAKRWDRSFGGSAADDLYALWQASDGSFLLGGYSRSGTSSDKTQPNRGGSDFWVLKLSADPTLVTVPTAHIIGDTVACATQATTLTVQTSVGATAYRWNTGDTTPSLVIKQPGTYSVVAFFSTGLVATASYSVRARNTVPLPAISLGPDTTLCMGQRFTLRAPAISTGLTYQWSDGSVGAHLMVEQPGTYSLTITSACETRTVTRTVRVGTCTPSVDPTLRIPNIITPNGDGFNERFVVIGLGQEAWTLELFNRWGTRVYTTPRYVNDWGSDSAPGLYYYSLRQTNGTKKYSGWLEVLR